MSKTPSSTTAKNALKLSINRAVPGDALAIVTLKRDAWLGAYVNKEHDVSEADIEKKFPKSSLPHAAANWEEGIASEKQKNDRATFVARIDGRIVGFTSPTTEDGQKRIGQLYVSQGIQGKGVGTELLSQAVKWHGRRENIYLHVVSYNQNAIEFYKNNGFQPTGVEFPSEYDNVQGIKLLPEIEMVLPAISNKV